MSFLLSLFSLRETETGWAGEGQRETENESQTESEAGFKLTNHEIMTWAKTKSQMFNQLSHPGASSVFLSLWGSQEITQPFHFVMEKLKCSWKLESQYRRTSEVGMSVWVTRSRKPTTQQSDSSWKTGQLARDTHVWQSSSGLLPSCH